MYRHEHETIEMENEPIIDKLSRQQAALAEENQCYQESINRILAQVQNYVQEARKTGDKGDAGAVAEKLKGCQSMLRDVAHVVNVRERPATFVVPELGIEAYQEPQETENPKEKKKATKGEKKAASSANKTAKTKKAAAPKDTAGAKKNAAPAKTVKATKAATPKKPAGPKQAAVPKKATKR
eukprot:GHVT01047423.1.p1 GENE.GHVT01047423.1~~GHVT01047423.1.p1  ORF type:complete len:182 (-),score=35.39 GHVT01047423.1:127-672(-)